MRVEPYTIDSFIHVVKRGTRGLPITNNDEEKWRFTRLLFYANDEYKSELWERETKDLDIFERPKSWPERKPIVKILAWTLMSNHFHLLLKEIKEGGITKFMQRLCGSMSTHFNLKYKEKGSLFQGPYRSKTVNEDEHMRYLAAYIMVKNVFELYPGGYKKAVREFEDAWNWAVSVYPFSSLADYAGSRTSPIIEKDILGEMFKSKKDFKNCARDMIFGRAGEAEIEIDSNLFLE